MQISEVEYKNVFVRALEKLTLARGNKKWNKIFLLVHKTLFQVYVWLCFLIRIHVRSIGGKQYSSGIRSALQGFKSHTQISHRSLAKQLQVIRWGLYRLKASLNTHLHLQLSLIIPQQVAGWSPV